MYHGTTLVHEAYIVPATFPTGLQGLIHLSEDVLARASHPQRALGRPVRLGGMTGRLARLRPSFRDSEAHTHVLCLSIARHPRRL